MCLYTMLQNALYLVQQKMRQWNVNRAVKHACITWFAAFTDAACRDAHIKYCALIESICNIFDSCVPGYVAQ